VEPAYSLGPNQYGKAEVRVVRITRDTAVHQIGDFDVAFLAGDNAPVVATDTQKNVVYAFAQQHGITSPEEFLLLLGRHFTSEYAWVTGGRWEAEAYGWERISVGGQPHDHAFVRTGQETRTAVVTLDGETAHVISGLTDLVVLKSTGSEFTGYPQDRFTTLPETTDRILATAVTARWRYASTDVDVTVDFNKAYDSIKAILLEQFAALHSLALQQTLYAMGTAVLEAHPDVAEIRFSMPNKHHFLVDLSPFGIDNPNEVFFAADRPYGLIEASVLRNGAPEAGRAWEGIAGFC
jgi:urate oxidase